MPDHSRVEGDVLADVVALWRHDDIEVVLEGLAKQDVLDGAARAFVGLQKDYFRLGLTAAVVTNFMLNVLLSMLYVYTTCQVHNL